MMNLLPGQLGFLRSQAAQPGSAAQTIAMSARLRGGVQDERALTRALEITLAEAQGIQLRVRATGDVLRTGSGPIPVTAVRFDSPADYASWLAGRLRVPFHLDGGPLVDGYVVTVGDKLGFLLVAHHAAADGYTALLLRERIAELYQSLTDGVEPPPSQFADPATVYAEYEAAPVNDPRWGDRLDTSRWPNPRISPADAVAPPSDTPLRRTRRLTVAPTDRDWPKRAIGLVGAYVARITGNRRAVVGAVLTNRRSDAERRTPLSLTAVVPVRVDLEAGTRGDDLAAQVSDGLAIAHDGRVDPHELFMSLPGVLRTGRLYGPTVNVIPYLRDRHPEWTTELHTLGPVPDLHAILVPARDGGIDLRTEFNPALYSPEDAERHAERLAAWLSATLEDGSARPDETDVLLPDERDRHAALRTDSGTSTGTGGGTSTLAWGERCGPHDLAAAAGVDAWQGITVDGDDGHPVPFGTPGTVTVLTADGPRPTDLLVALTRHGCVYRGRTSERLRLPGAFAEPGFLRRAAMHTPDGAPDPDVEDLVVSAVSPPTVRVRARRGARPTLRDELRERLPSGLRLTVTTD